MGKAAGSWLVIEISRLGFKPIFHYLVRTQPILEKRGLQRPSTEAEVPGGTSAAIQIDSCHRCR